MRYECCFVCPVHGSSVCVNAAFVRAKAIKNANVYLTDRCAQQQVKAMKALRKLLASPGHRSWLNADILARNKVAVVVACMMVMLLAPSRSSELFLNTERKS